MSSLFSHGGAIGGLIIDALAVIEAMNFASFLLHSLCTIFSYGSKYTNHSSLQLQNGRNKAAKLFFQYTFLNNRITVRDMYSTCMCTALYKVLHVVAPLYCTYMYMYMELLIVYQLAWHKPSGSYQSYMLSCSPSSFATSW